MPTHHPQPNNNSRRTRVFPCNVCANEHCNGCHHKTDTAERDGGGTVVYEANPLIRAASMRYGALRGTILRNPLEYFSDN